jgi:hypothetical protein
MEKLDRRALKDKFKKGKMPSENDFSNLIDSMINILEEGFDKTSDDGLKVSQLMGSGRLMSFYENIAVDSPQWFLELGIGDNKLNFGTTDTPSVLSLRSYEARENGETNKKVAVGINKESPRATLDVEGTVASTGRSGQPGDMPVLANGDWHDITPVLTGCEAFEVVAGVGGKDSDGKYALVRAIALNTFNGKSSIEQQPAYFGSKCNRIELRWHSVPEQGPFYYKLQMRVQCAYFSNSEKNKIWIKYHITRLWFDSLMVDSNLEF